MADHETDSAQETALEEITDAELYDAFIEAAQSDLHTCCPCTVTAVDGRTVTVTPGINRYVPDGAGNLISEPLPQLKDVPIGDQMANGMLISLPVAAGDTGMLIFSERPLGAWRATGQQGDPGDVGMHTLDGAIFVPMLQPDAKVAKSASATNLVIGSDTNQAARIVIQPTMILAGENATNFVAMADKLQTAFATFTTMLNTIFGAASVPLSTPIAGAPDPVYTALKAAVSALFAATTWPITATAVAASNLKAED